MRVALPTLRRLLEENVLEIKFVRRRQRLNQSPTRRMLCTNSSALLNTQEGREALKFVPSKQSPKYNPTSRNLVIAWDIFMQGYRTINVEACELISQIPANDEFWKYFSENKYSSSEEN